MGSSTKMAEKFGSVTHQPLKSATEATSLLRGTVKLAEETNELAGGISEDMRNQRAQLEDGSERIRDMKGFTAEARRIMNGIKRRAVLHKAMLYVIILFLLALILLILYRMGTNHGHII